MRLSNHTLLAAMAVSGVVMATGHARAATTLDFVTGLGNGQGIPDTYGDRASGTPNVDITWGTDTDASEQEGWDSYPGWDGRGEVGQTDYKLSPVITVHFAADPGFGVFVSSFDMDEWIGGGDSVVNWELVGTAFSGTWNDFSDAMGGDGGRTTVFTGMTAADALAGTLSLQLTLASGDGTYQAIDNLTFDQVAIPEPGTAALALGGLSALVMRRKRA